MFQTCVSSWCVLWCLASAVWPHVVRLATAYTGVAYSCRSPWLAWTVWTTPRIKSICWAISVRTRRRRFPEVGGDERKKRYCSNVKLEKNTLSFHASFLDVIWLQCGQSWINQTVMTVVTSLKHMGPIITESSITQDCLFTPKHWTQDFK